MRRILFLGEPFDIGIANNDHRIIASLPVSMDFCLDKVHPKTLANAITTEIKINLNEYSSVKLMVVDVKDEVQIPSNEIIAYST